MKPQKKVITEINKHKEYMRKQRLDETLEAIDNRNNKHKEYMRNPRRSCNQKCQE